MGEITILGAKETMFSEQNLTTIAKYMTSLKFQSQYFLILIWCSSDFTFHGNRSCFNTILSRSMGEHFALMHLGVEITMFYSLQIPFHVKKILRLGTTSVTVIFIKFPEN